MEKNLCSKVAKLNTSLRSPTTLATPVFGSARSFHSWRTWVSPLFQIRCFCQLLHQIVWIYNDPQLWLGLISTKKNGSFQIKFLRNFQIFPSQKWISPRKLDFFGAFLCVFFGGKPGKPVNNPGESGESPEFADDGRPMAVFGRTSEVERGNRWQVTGGSWAWKKNLNLQCSYQVLPSDPFGGFKWPFQGLSDLHLGDQKVTWKKLV